MTVHAYSRSPLRSALILAMIAPLAAVSFAADRYWVASSAANWNEPANWATNSGGTGGEGVAAAPGAANTAIFDGNGLGNCSLDAAVNVLGFRIEAGNTGTITQDDNTVTVGAGGYYQAAGVFAGGSADITVQGLPNRFELAGGTFTNTSATLSLTGGYVNNTTLFLFSGGSFHHNNGTLRFAVQYANSAARSHTLSIRQPLTLHHLTFTGGASAAGRTLGYVLDLQESGAMVVGGTFTADRANPANINETFSLTGGQIEIRGDVVVGPGADSGTTRLVINGTGDQTYASTGGRLPHVIIDKPSGSFAPSVGTTCWNVWRFELESGAFTAPAEVLDIGGFRSASGGNYTLFGVTGGSYAHDNGTVRLFSAWDNDSAGTHTVRLNQPLTLPRLVLTGGAGRSNRTLVYAMDFSGGGSLKVLSDLSIERHDDTATRTLLVNGERIEAQGGVFVGPGTTGGTTQILLSGTNDQAIAQTTNGVPPQGHWTIDKASGAAMLSTDLVLSGASQDLVWTNGSLHLATNTLAVGRNVLISANAATLGVAIAADGAKAGRLQAVGTVGDIGYADLAVTVRAARAAVAGRDYVILTNATPLTTEFASVAWSSPDGRGWKGDVDYTANDGKTVTLENILTPSGTVILFR